jgi:hypothetical protein
MLRRREGDDHPIVRNPKKEAIVDQIAILSSFDGRKTTFLLALISIASPRSRMAAHTGSTLAHLQNSETDELYPIARLQVRRDHADEVLQ